MSTDLSHLSAREADIFRAGKSQYRITEPLNTFYEAVMRPSWVRLESGRATEVWAPGQGTAHRAGHGHRTAGRRASAWPGSATR